MKNKKKRVILWLIILAVLVIAAVVTVKVIQAKTTDALQNVLYQTYTVERGTVESTITASGQLSAADTRNVLAPDGMTVTRIRVVAGDPVKTGDVLCELDPDSVRKQLIYELKQSTASENHLGTVNFADSVTAPAQGRLKYQPVQVGDDVLTSMLNYGCLAILSLDGYMNLQIDTAAELTLGSKVMVTWDGGKSKGTVKTKTATGYVILVPDDHAPYQGIATAFTYDDNTEIGSGTLLINLPSEVYGYDGTIRKVAYHVDESVPDGRTMFTLDNAPAATNYVSRYVERTDLSDRYAELIKLYANPCLLAPCDGVVSEISVTLDGLTGKADKSDRDSIAFTLQTGGSTKLTVDMNELDILSAQLGQTATVSIDAIPGETFDGTVSRISQIGKKQNSVSTFPVELLLGDDARFLSGMNASATILVSRSENVLTIPIDAIGEDSDGEYVFVLSPSGERVRTAITTGMSDGTTAEVVSGLSEGDVVSYELPGLDLSAMYGAMGMPASEE